MAAVHKTFLKRAVASQKLRGVVVDYEVLCKSTSKDYTPGVEVENLKSESEPVDSMKRGSLLQNVRGLLKNMTQSETEQGRRVQTALAGLPSFMREKIMGEETTKKDDDDSVEKLINDMQEKKPTQAKDKVDLLQKEDSADGIRAKYLEKMNAAKQRAKQRTNHATIAQEIPDDIPKESTKMNEKSDLPTRKVNEGTNEFLSYIGLRGLALGVIPPASKHRQEEFQQFVAELKYLDAVLDYTELSELPKPVPILNISKKLDLEPKDIIVISSSDAAISSGKYAGTYTCFLPEKPSDTNHDCDYSIPNLREFKYIVEELNGISWRRG